MPSPRADINDPEVVAEVCQRLASGETTRKVTQSLGATFEKEFWKRMQVDPSFSATVARAREAGQDALTAETIDIADSADEQTVNVAKLRIWARQWYASKLAPKKYGDRTALEHSGPEGGPLTVSWTAAVPAPAAHLPPPKA